MKLYINGKYRITRITGVQRVAIEIISALRQEIAERALSIELKVLEPPNWLMLSRFRPILALLWEQLVLPFAASDGVLLSLCNTGPVLGKRQAIMLHDAAVFDMPENYGSQYVRVQRWFMRRHASRVHRILTVSKFSRGRLAHWLQLEESDIGVLSNGSEHILRNRDEAEPAVLDRLGIAEDNYFLAIGSRQPGKNFGALLEAACIAKLSLPIVIVGGADVHVFGHGEMLQSGHLIDAGYVTDGELFALLKHARCYVQPSLYEGFGLPVIEAMALGIPVLCSRAASLPEVCGDAAMLFDPCDPADIARAMEAFLADDKLRASLSRSGLLRAQAYSWRATAGRLLDEMELLT